MSLETSYALPQFDGTAALRPRQCGLVLIEGGLSGSAAPSPSPRRAPRRGALSPRQFMCFVLLSLIAALSIAVSSIALDAARTASAQSALDSAPREVVTVQAGDTLWGIAESHASSLDTRVVMDWIEGENALVNGTLAPGSRLVVPAL